MAGPGVLPISIYLGDTFELPLRLRSIDAEGILGDYLDLTGWTLKAQIRDTTDGTVRAEFTVEPGDQGDPPAIDGGQGYVLLSLTHLQTAALPADAESRWDLQYTDTLGKVRTLLKGSVTLEGEITE